MANEFFTILTATGRNKLANATATATPLNLTQMAVGDGDNGAYYIPTEAQTTLKHEVWRGAINHLAVDVNNPNWIVAELVIPDNVGGFYIREVGLFDSTGAMIAVGKFPESYKPTLAAGSNKQLYVRMILEVANTSAVTLLVDPSVVLATRQYCDDKVADELNKRDGKQSVRVATTAAIALAGLQTIDGVVLVAGDRVLVKDQAAGAENGIYVAAAGAWTRATDADSGTKLNAGALVPVEAGTVNADTIWMLKTDGAIIIGATSISFQWAGGLNAPTQAAGDNSTKIANMAAVQAAIAALVASSPAALDTLNELAAALGNDANFATTITNALALKAPLASPALTGTPAAPTPAQFDNSTKLATTAFVKTAQGNLSGLNAYNASTNIPLADIGKLVAYYGGTAGQTLTLPAVATVPTGYGYTLVNQSSKDVTIKGNGAENINYNIAQTGQGIANTIVLSPGDSIEISSNGVDKWNVVGFTSTQQFPSSKSPLTIGAAGAARGSIGSSGYHKYPNGVIEQWATIQLADSVATTWTFPVSFPNACMGIDLQNLAIAAGQSGNTVIALPQVGGITASTANIETRNTQTAGTLTWFFVRVIGY